MKILIKVTEKDIENGKINNPTSCPIASAVKRRISDRLVIIGVDKMMLDNDYVVLPQRALEFINHFDNKKKIKPFNFYLSI